MQYYLQFRSLVVAFQLRTHKQAATPISASWVKGRCRNGAGAGGRGEEETDLPPAAEEEEDNVVGPMPSQEEKGLKKRKGT